MDHSAHAAAVFHKHADLYREKFMDLSTYLDSYREFCGLLRPGQARVLDAACGPGNVSRYLIAQRPELEVLGIDLAPRMIELARATVPSARFLVHDCRRLAELGRRFDGIICAFGLPYFSPAEAAAFITATSQALEPGGILYLSAMLGAAEEEGFQRCSTGDEIYVNYHREKALLDWIQEQGLSILKRSYLDSPPAASRRTTDVIIIAIKPLSSEQG